MDAERIFVDTNVLLAATDRERAAHAEALAFLKEGLEGRIRLFASGQIFREYLVVATRPVDQNGLGLAPQNAVENVQIFQQVIQVLDESAESAHCLLGLVEAMHINGKLIHDANVVATMMSHGLSTMKTWNTADFARFPEIHLLANEIPQA